MNYDFSNLQQTSENCWQAHYHGNYGIYTVKIEFDENGNRKRFSCTCPSDSYPCKHIGYLQTEIKKQAEKFKIKQTKNELTVEEILQHVSLEELKNFIVKKAKFNHDLTKAITLEFTEKQNVAKKTGENIYKSLVRNDLNEIEFDNGDYYEYDDGAETDLSILGEWYDKAKSFITEQKYNDALLICQAVIEEYAEWYNEADENIRDFIFQDYQEDFFALLKRMVENNQMDTHTLYEYCKQESKKKIYYGHTQKLFNDLMARLAKDENSDEFIALQKDLLKNIADKSSFDAETVVMRLYEFYLSNNEKDNAEKWIEENVQIERCCKLAIEKRIAEERLAEAKQMIFTFLENHKNRYNDAWNDYLLKIAQKENDVPTIRKISFGFIENKFETKYFNVYKSTFSDEEWKIVFEKLYAHYEKKDKNTWYSHSYNVMDLLAAEKLAEKLLDYVNTHLTAETLECYYLHFVKQNTEKTLKMWRNALDFYAEKNVGETHYMSICRWLKLIQKIEGGHTLVVQMINNYRTLYKRRPKMMELLNQL
jgi:hypothetical protein